MTTTAKSTFTIEIYEVSRIEWAQAHPEMLTRRQRHQARVMPESFGALPSYIFTGRKSREAAESATIGYRDPAKFIVRITEREVAGE